MLIFLKLVNAVNNFIETFASFCFKPLITKPTRINSNCSTFSLLDNIFSNVCNVGTSGIIVSDVSDHFPVFYISSFRTNSLCHTKSSNRNLSKNNISKFIQIISNTNWNSVLNNDDPEASYNEFLRIFLYHYEHCFPVRKRSKNSPRKDWCTQAIANSCKTKCKLYKKFVKNPTDENKRNYILFRNKLNSVIKVAKRKYYFNLFRDSNIKDTWTCINSIMNKSSGKVIPRNLNIDGHKVSNLDDICESLNNYFTDIGPNLASKITGNINDPLIYLSDPNCSSFFMSPTDVNEVSKCIFNLNVSSPGFDGIHPKVVKSVALSISEPLSHIINLSFLKGIVPSKLKIARVVPVFKSGPHDVISNYRPISVLPCFSKIFEKLSFNRIYAFLVKHSILFKHQFGFLPSKNTSHAIISLVDYVLDCFENKSLSCGIFLDLSKAFDTIDHTILLRKMHNYGIRGSPLSWFSNYLCNRRQYVSILDCNSVYRNIRCGVPQGSILGPLLFLLYINDLPNVSSKFSFILYADDSNILFNDPDINSLVHNINTEMPNVITWFNSNKLHLNAKKSVAILFRPRQKHVDLSNYHIIIDNTVISFSNHTKFLGVIPIML